MVLIEICVGSACYVRGSKSAIELMKGIIQKNNWEDKVELKGSFCMDECHCHSGLGIKINHQVINDIGLYNLAEIIEERVRQLL